MRDRGRLGSFGCRVVATVPATGLTARGPTTAAASTLTLGVIVVTVTQAGTEVVLGRQGSRTGAAPTSGTATAGRGVILDTSGATTPRPEVDASSIETTRERTTPSVGELGPPRRWAPTQREGVGRPTVRPRRLVTRPGRLNGMPSCGVPALGVLGRAHGLTVARRRTAVARH